MLLPDPKRRGEIHFAIAKSLPYNPRILLATGLLVVGLLLQLWVHPALGAVLLLAASLLVIVEGYTNQPDAEIRGRKRDWRAGEKAQLQKILEIARKSKQWDETAIDITCATGMVTLLLVGIGVAGLAFAVFPVGDGRRVPVVLMDAAFLLLPHWVTGVRSILVNAPLTVKVENLLRVYTQWEQDRREDESMVVQIQVAILSKTEEVPVDAKLVLNLPPLGDDFLGVQVQVVLNNVQGSDFPYVYCVLVARQGLQMPRKLSPSPPAQVVAEWRSEDEMDLLIVRQRTTKTSGYHTSRADVSKIFAFARSEARKLLTESPPTAAPAAAVAPIRVRKAASRSAAG